MMSDCLKEVPAAGCRPMTDLLELLVENQNGNGNENVISPITNSVMS